MLQREQIVGQSSLPRWHWAIAVLVDASAELTFIFCFHPQGSTSTWVVRRSKHFYLLSTGNGSANVIFSQANNPAPFRAVILSIFPDLKLTPVRENIYKLTLTLNHNIGGFIVWSNALSVRSFEVLGIRFSYAPQPNLCFFRPWNETFSFPQEIANNYGHFDI